MTTERISITPTYDHRETGDRFSVQTRVRDRLVSSTPLRDPFMRHRVVIGWRDLLAGVVSRRIEVIVRLDGDPEIVEDVCELDADYAGRFGSTRRAEWRAQIQAALSDFAGSAAARSGEPS